VVCYEAFLLAAQDPDVPEIFPQANAETSNTGSNLSDGDL
jgi:hypothetical protein